MKKAKKPALSSAKASTFLAAGYKFVQFDNGALLLQKGTDLRLFRFAEYRTGGDPVNGSLVVTFAAKVP